MSPSDLALGQQREAAVPAAAHPASPAHLGPSSTRRWTDGEGARAWRLAAMVTRLTPPALWTLQGHLCCLESARQRNQVFIQADPCHPGRALVPTKGLLFPGPQGQWGRDWAEVIWSLVAWLGVPSLLPSSSFTLSLPPASAQLHALQVSKANG